MPWWAGLEPGEQYGRLTVLGRAPDRSGRPAYMCRCSCGNTKEIRESSLTGFRTRSCGCLRRESLYVVHQNNPNAMTYHKAMTAIYAAKGMPSVNACIDCGGPSEHWSYDGFDEDELYELKVKYSLKINHYVARCTSCHVKALER